MAQAIKMPIRKAEVDFGEIGYEGWVATLRLNPIARVYDVYMAVEAGEEHEQEEWEAFSKFIIEWNLADEEGNLLPIPCDIMVLPRKVTNFLVSKWWSLFRAEIELPKELSPNLESSSQTNGEVHSTSEVLLHPESISPSSSPIDGQPQMALTTG